MKLDGQLNAIEPHINHNCSCAVKICVRGVVLNTTNSPSWPSGDLNKSSLVIAVMRYDITAILIEAGYKLDRRTLDFGGPVEDSLT